MKNINKLSQEELDALAQKVGATIGKDMEKLSKKAKRLLKPLGLDIKVLHLTFPVGTDPLELIQSEHLG